MTLKIGAIADDFTGATDLAVTLVNGGMRVAQVFGVPMEPVDLSKTDAVVIALKTRTATPSDAVSQSLAALKWLQQHDVAQVFFKYCSTFDSSDQGNIGPVADALASELGTDLAVICPAFPENHRTVYRGHLFVGDQLLSDSPMRNHPLTPMRQSNLVALMDAQSRHKTGLIPLEVVQNGKNAVRQSFRDLSADGLRYAVVDAVRNADLHVIGQAVASHKLVTGGSGVALGLPANFGFSAQTPQPVPISITGRSVVLAGSCSAASRAQIAYVSEKWPVRKIDVDAIAAGGNVVADLLSWASSQDPSVPVLLFASADPDEVAEIQSRHGVAQSGEMVETAMAQLAVGLRAGGFNRMVIAGGETSGAVVSALKLTALKICSEIDPGVPWTQTLTGEPMVLALKSGNFGTVDFFEKAFKVLS